jgi:phosphopantothenoylcysteine decarboxylase / phosphopantothenate---cysteine ligase
MSDMPINVTHQPPRRLLLGVTGGIAAYKSAELVRELTKAGYDVHVVMTKSAQQFITPLTMQALSGNAVWTDQWDDRPVNGKANAMPHIELSRGADLILVAPATADFLAKAAHGMADDLLTTLCIARNRDTCRLVVAPAMNREMWDNPATQRNVATLMDDGVQILGPEGGDQACGEVGMGRMMEPAALAAAVSSRFAPQSLSGRRVLVTAGPTFEAIDPVRGITNHSSGKMGYAIAQAAIEAGARVTLISGPTSLPAPAVDSLIYITSARQLFDAVKSNIDGIDLFFSVAAVADYTPKSPSAHKIKKSSDALTIELEPTKDVLAYVAGLPSPPFCVGFAAESQNVAELAAKKREKKGIPLIVANLAQTAIGSDTNEVTLIDAGSSLTLASAPKPVIARQIIEFVSNKLSAPPRLKAVGSD